MKQYNNSSNLKRNILQLVFSYMGRGCPGVVDSPCRETVKNQTGPFSFVANFFNMSG